MKVFIIDVEDGNNCLGNCDFSVVPDIGDSLVYRVKQDGEWVRLRLRVKHRRFVATDGQPEATIALSCISERAWAAEMGTACDEDMEG